MNIASNRSGPSRAALKYALMAAVVLTATPGVAAQQHEDCIVRPRQDHGDSRSSENMKTQPLSDCTGVLRPEPVGDGELVEPAPQAGQTPVIEPDEVPEQPLRD